MAPLRIPLLVARRALLALAGGASIDEAAAGAGIGPRTLDRLIDEHRPMRNRETKRRTGALTLEEREEIRIGIERGESDTEIAGRIGRHRSTVWREIRVNGGRRAYRAVRADERADEAQKRPRRSWVEDRPWLWEIVQGYLLVDRWSPEQIAARLRRDHPDDPRWGLLEIAIKAVEDYEARNYPDIEETLEKNTNPASILRVLMDQYQLHPSDFPEIGSQKVVSEILDGSREFTLTQAKALSERFHIEPTLFL